MRCHAALAVLALVCLAATAADPPGFRPRPRSLHALTGARVIPRPGTELTNVTIAISNGLISTVSAEPPPAAARLWDLRGLTVYAGFLDPYVATDPRVQPVSTTGSQPIDQGGSGATASDDTSGPRFYGVPGQEPDPGNPGPGAISRSVTPELRIAAGYSPDRKRVEGLRELGFAAANVVPARGLFRGEAALFALGDAGPNSALIRPDTAQCLAFDAGRAGDDDEPLGASPYPASLMGVIALIRQTLLDARHHEVDQAHYAAHPNTRPRPAANLALEALAPVLRGPPRVPGTRQRPHGGPRGPARRGVRSLELDAHRLRTGMAPSRPRRHRQRRGPVDCADRVSGTPEVP